MDNRWLGQARRWIVGGYLVALVASVVNFVGRFPSFTHEGLTAVIAIDVAFGPVIAAASLWTWWWLSQLNARDETQRRLIRNGVAGLIVLLVAEATLSFTSFTSLVSFNSVQTWVLATFLLSTLGEVAAAVGFLLALYALRRTSTASEGGGA
jgi:hypothetical protein